jgi:hypothetical protein
LGTVPTHGLAEAMSAPPPRLARVDSKVKRAEQHIQDLGRAIGAFLDSKPYGTAAKTYQKPRRVVYYVSGVKEIPATISLMVGDAIHNLRSALDHLVYQLVLANLETPSRDTSFPIYDSASKYKAHCQAKIKGISRTAEKLIDAAAPYRGGNDDLWVLHQLNNIDKHRLLVTVGLGYSTLTLPADEVYPRLKRLRDRGQLFRAFDYPQRPVSPIKVGDILYTDEAGDEVNEEIQFAFEVAFDEAQVVPCQPVLATLDKLLHLVDGIVQGFASQL